MQSSSSSATQNRAGTETKVKVLHQLSKTTLCNFFAAGSCPNGADCKFAHGTQELQSKPNFCKTSICKAWKAGKCKKTAAKCQFAHGYSDIRTTSGFDGKSGGAAEDQRKKRSEVSRRHAEKSKPSAGGEGPCAEEVEHGTIVSTAAAPQAWSIEGVRDENLQEARLDLRPLELPAASPIWSREEATGVEGVAENVQICRVNRMSEEFVQALQGGPALNAVRVAIMQAGREIRPSGMYEHLNAVWAFVWPEQYDMVLEALCASPFKAYTSYIVISKDLVPLLEGVVAGLVARPRVRIKDESSYLEHIRRSFISSAFLDLRIASMMLHGSLWRDVQ
eukprot:TRINITY_DN7597_c0_g1_i2.p1 TRINITY_DN7597_c0_g1~~TRINITY_DN7597_c0_g1_i2.p1  ORF type:complete len:335 (-),score=67.02 TRINITY_DN7597_c0_g1_i2:385-1389(-)